MNEWQALLFGVLQGMTEFLPVSSSGHLVVARQIMGYRDPGVIFEVFVHFGTMLSVLIAFRRDLTQIIRDFLRFYFVKHSQKSDGEKENVRFVWYIFLASIPAAVVGFTLQDWLSALFIGDQAILRVAIALTVTGTFLFFTRYAQEREAPLGTLPALLIGLAQAFAIVPGISRSGATISMALFLGWQRGKAARFSFLLSVPIIFGATLKQSIDLISEGVFSLTLFWPVLLATVSAAASGYVAVIWLLEIVKRNRLSVFAYYCWSVGLALVLFYFSS